MGPGQNKSPERAFALQKYLLLHSQHDALQKHITQISISVPNTPSRSPERSPDFTLSSPTRSHASSLSSSPESQSNFLPASAPPHHHRHHHRNSISALTPSRPRMVKRRSSLPAIIDENILGELEEEEGKLKNVNEQIKCTLTDLLNCESVRNDRQYRMWVQTRLMNTEKELKGDRAKSCDRRRRESDVGFSENLGGHFEVMGR